MINILLLNWKSFELVRVNLHRLVLSEDRKFRVILINNYSDQAELLKIKELVLFFSQKLEIYLVENITNLGYAGGNNSGLNFLSKNNFTGDLLILNPDILISKNTIYEMRKALTKDVGIVTVRTKNSNHKILFDAIKLKGYMQSFIITSKESIESDYSQGACLLIKREVINQIGLFDERFFLYWEEVDFSMRVKKLGMKLIAISTTCVIRLNNEIKRQPLAFYYSVRNAKLIKSKHPDHFSNIQYLIYIGYIIGLSLKFLPRIKIFFLVFGNILTGIKDSQVHKYSGK